MGIKQYKEYLQQPPLKVLQKEKKKANKRPWLIILIIALLTGAIYFESKQDKETIESFIENSLTVKDKQLKYELCNVTTKQANHIKELTGKDVAGFKWVMDNYTLRHVLKHKDIRLNDYEKLCISFNTYDSLKLATRHLKEVDKLEMYKTYDNLIKIIIEVRKKELYVLTMYKVY